jgi:replicative DNA helicase
MAADVNPPTPQRRPPERRKLPFNEEIEASILGGVILRNEVLADLADVETDDFFVPKHRVILAGDPEPRGRRQADRSHDARVRDRARGQARGDRRRRVHRRARAARADDRQLSEIAARLLRIEESSAKPAKKFKLISVSEAIADMESLAKAPVYPTPFPTLNDAIGFGGFLGTQVYTVAAGTGRGKTTWVAKVGTYVASLQPVIPVLVVSYEMKPGYFVARKAAGVLGVHSNAIIRGEIAFARVLNAMPYPNLYLMHKPTLAEVRAAVNFVKQTYGVPPLVIVDYIQKLAHEISLTQQRVDLRLATTQASATLCDIAERTGAAIIAVSAIGRGKGQLLSNPRKKEPYELVEVAKESGDVEYDGAGLIVLSLSNDYDGDDRIATMTMAKVRFGEECHIDARYNGRRGDWRDVGRAEVSVAAVKTPPDDGLVRAAILTVLAKGPQTSKTNIAKLTGKNKTAVLSELDVMRAEGLIEHTTMGGWRLPGTGSGTGPQTSIDGVPS